MKIFFGRDQKLPKIVSMLFGIILLAEKEQNLSQKSSMMGFTMMGRLLIHLLLGCGKRLRRFLITRNRSG